MARFARNPLCWEFVELAPHDLELDLKLVVMLRRVTFLGMEFGLIGQLAKRHGAAP